MLVYFANDIYQVVSAPLIKQMPLGATMIATDVASPFFTPIKLTFWVSLIASAPVILYQVWAFVAPALYKHERKLVIPLLVSSSLLFYIGMAFAYFVVFPLAFGFLTHTAPEGVQVSTDIASYLSFVMALFMAFGVAFEVPVAIVLLCWVGVTTPDDLRKKRPYIWSARLWLACCSHHLTSSHKHCWQYRCIVCSKSAYSSRVSTWEKGVGRMTKTIRRKRPLKSKTSRPSGRLCYGESHV